MADSADVLYERDLYLPNNEALVLAKFVQGGDSSKFYGCFTAKFAQQWNSIFHLASAGAVMKIDFSVTNLPSAIPEILPRLERSEPNTGWTEFLAKGR